MSYIGFLTRAFSISPIVFLRYIPIVFIFGLVVFGLFQMSDNIYVLVMMSFILATVGQTFLYITGVRGALQTIKATDAPTLDALMKITFRLMLSQMLIMLVMVMAMTTVFFMGITLLFLDTAASAAADALGNFIGSAMSFNGEKMAEAAFALSQMEGDDAALRAASLALTFSQQLAVGITISIWGIPLAAMSANAVHKSPGNDLIYGIGRYFPHQMTLYILATMVPSYVLIMLTPVEAYTPGTGQEGSIAIGLVVLGLWMLFAPCVSFAGMAIGYELIQKKVWGRLQQERVPVIDYEAEREGVRALRELRLQKAGEATFYDPNKKADPTLAMDDSPSMDPDEFDDEVRNSLRSMRQSRRGDGVGKVYDPRNPDNDD